jgi:hypothetical protein
MKPQLKTERRGGDGHLKRERSEYVEGQENQNRIEEIVLN